MSPEAYLQMQAVEREHWWFAGRRAIIASIISKIGLPKAPDILEAGCGTGGNLNLLSTFGRTYAFEMNATALDIARKNNQAAEVRQGQLPDAIPYENLMFDLVCMFDVLEHVENDLAALQALSEKINPGGYLFVTVPALPMLWSEHDVKLHHYRRYMREQLADVIEQAGLESCWMSYFNFTLLPLALLSRWYARFTGNKPTGEEMPPVPVNRIFRNIFLAERYWLFPKKLPIGLSLAVIARKPL